MVRKAFAADISGRPSANKKERVRPGPLSMFDHPKMTAMRRLMGSIYIFRRISQGHRAFVAGTAKEKSGPRE
jgi:hypothetical protein